MTSATLARQQVQRALARLAAEGRPELAALAAAAVRAAEVVGLDSKAPGNLAGALLIVLSRSRGIGSSQSLTTVAVVKAIRE